MPTTPERKLVANRVRDILIGLGLYAKVWERGGYVRVYVHDFAGAGSKDFGRIEIQSDGMCNYRGLQVRRAELRGLVEKALLQEKP